MKKTLKCYLLLLTILLILYPLENSILNKFRFIKNYANKVKVNFWEIVYKKNECSISNIQDVPKRSTIIIGHAYGSHTYSNIRDKNGKEFIAPSVKFFLDSNINNIDNIIFTGDVFQKPNKEKWINLLKEYSEKANILISPGNHDIGDKINHKYRNNYSKIIKDVDSYPYIFKTIKMNMILDNSVDRKNLINDKILNLYNNNSEKKSILLRHHVAIRELSFLSNDKSIYKSIPTARDIDKKINNITVISVDGGAFSHLPRINCYKFGTNKYIVNGIGEMKGDTILIINGNMIFRKIIVN